MKGKLAFRVIGFGFFGLAIGSFLLHVAWQIKNGHGGDTYYNYKFQPMTYWSLVGTLATGVVAAIVGLVFRGREMLERWKHAKWRRGEQAVAPDRRDERRSD
jgi:H+/Cl- antiporter ClcA